MHVCVHTIVFFFSFKLNSNSNNCPFPSHLASCSIHIRFIWSEISMTSFQWALNLKKEIRSHQRSSKRVRERERERTELYPQSPLILKI